MMSQMNLSELTSSEKFEIQGGDSQVTYRDSQGYDWTYNYNDGGELTSITVSRQMCIQ